MSRNERGLKEALAEIPQIRQEFWGNVNILGGGEDLNQSLERAGRVGDFLEFAELLVTDALHRKESAGGHFREECQTPEGEAKRDDENFSYVAAWQFQGVGKNPLLHKEILDFKNIELAQRNYK